MTKIKMKSILKQTRKKVYQSKKSLKKKIQTIRKKDEGDRKNTGNNMFRGAPKRLD
jgi:hypothetical protein